MGKKGKIELAHTLLPNVARCLQILRYNSIGIFPLLETISKKGLS